MEHFDTPSTQVNTGDSPLINNRQIETMSLEELDDAIVAVAHLTQAIHQRRQQLMDAPHIAAPDAPQETPNNETTKEHASPLIIDKAAQELQQFYQSPRGKAIVRAIADAYEAPGTIQSITKSEVPLRKEALASVIKDIVPQIARTIVLDGHRDDIDGDIDVPLRLIKGYGGLRSANAIAQRLLASYYGTVSHLTVSMQEEIRDEASSHDQRHRFNLSITKQPTGKPAFTETVTVELTQSDVEPRDLGYRLLVHSKSSDQEAYEEDARRIARTVIAENIASPLSGGLVSPR